MQEDERNDDIDWLEKLLGAERYATFLAIGIIMGVFALFVIALLLAMITFEIISPAGDVSGSELPVCTEIDLPVVLVPDDPTSTVPPPPEATVTGTPPTSTVPPPPKMISGMTATPTVVATAGTPEPGTNNTTGNGLEGLCSTKTPTP